MEFGFSWATYQWQGVLSRPSLRCLPTQTILWVFTFCWLFCLVVPSPKLCSPPSQHSPLLSQRKECVFIQTSRTASYLNWITVCEFCVGWKWKSKPHSLSPCSMKKNPKQTTQILTNFSAGIILPFYNLIWFYPWHNGLFLTVKLSSLRVPYISISCYLWQARAEISWRWRARRLF